MTGPAVRAWRAVAGAIALSVFTCSATAQPNLEYAVKAEYLAKLPPFIDWPPGSFDAPDAPINLCLLGSDPFGAQLNRAAGEEVMSRVIAVRRLPSPDLAGACHILYLGSGQTLPEALSNRPVLTVSDSEAIPAMIQFVVRQNHVRFVIDEGAARRAGLHISAKLLALALSVKRGPP